MDNPIVISGGGIIGLSAAIAAAQHNNAVCIIDGGDFTCQDTESFHRVFAINGSSQRIFEHLGVWSKRIANDCAPYREMEVEDQVRSAKIAFNCRQLALPQLGHIISERNLKQALLQRIKECSTIECIPRERIHKIEHNRDYSRLTLGNGTIDTKMLVVAEGARSSTRDQLSVPLQEWSYHQSALVTRIRCERPHHNIARQRFLDSGPLAFLPLPDPNECSIVWSTRPGHANHLRECPIEVFNTQCTKAFSSWLGEVECIGERYSFPLHMRHAKQYYGNGWLILGDTAHSIHPLAGLGLNLGLADIAAWEHLVLQPNRIHCPKALATYQRQRRNEVWKVIALMQGLKELFSSTLTPVIQLRTLGMQLVNNSDFIKKALIKQAAGETV
jgi:2-polyprenylphenol 6-hydroxylase